MTENKYCQALEALRSQSAHELKEVGDQWRTPENIFWGINAMFGPLVLDLFADESNAKCEAFYTAEDNALRQDWSARLAELNGAAFGNPPYSRATQHEGEYTTGMRYIMRHASAMREKGGRYVFLIKAATSEVWWPEDADHIAFIRGRLGFDLPEWFIPKDEKQVPTGAFFAGAIAVFDKSWRGPAMSYISRKDLEARGDAFLKQIRREAERLMKQNVQHIQLQNIPEVIPGTDDTEELPTEETVSAEEKELPLTREDILAKSGITAWACISAAFGNKPLYTFSESKFGHSWADDSLENPEIIAVPVDTIARAKVIFEEMTTIRLLESWVSEHCPADLRKDMNDRLITVSEEFRKEYQLGISDFIAIVSNLEFTVLQNARLLRKALHQTLQESAA